MIRRIGRYEIEALLGRGGFGEVFKAFDPTVNRMVAVKVLTIESDPTALVRFRNEAAASGRLRHPNIVTIHDFGEQDGTPYIVMELLEGKDLQNVLTDRTAIEPWQRIQILSNIATGLGYAHSKGIIHRDVKPANVMLLPDGSIKIMDFGIALVSHETNTRLTKTGFVLGTFRYMAPEQYQGHEPDSRSDIFSLGLLAYELLTGIHPFHAKEPAALMYNVVHVDPVAISKLWPACPRGLDAVIARLLEKDPELRYQTLEDFAFDVQPTLASLRRDKANELFKSAQEAQAAGQLDAAQPLVRQALEMDAALPGARELRERIQREQRRQLVRPRVDEAVRQGRDKMSEGHLSAALEHFEAAARLDPTDTELVELLSAARSALEVSRKVAGMVDSATKALRGRDFDGARRIALDALALNPDSTAAQIALERADAGIEEQRAAAQLAERLQSARALVRSESWVEAEAFLAGARAEFPESEELRSLAGQVATGLARQQREQRLAASLATARGLLAAEDWDGAARALVELQKEFPGVGEAKEMLRRTLAQINKRNLEETIGAALKAALELSAKGQFQEAREALEAALKAAPADARLLEAAKSVTAAEAEATRRAALETALADVGRFRSGGQLKEAVQVLAGFRKQYRADPAAEQLERDLALEIEALELAARQREAACQEALAAAKKLAGEMKFDATLEALSGIEKQFGSRPEILALRNSTAAARDKLRAEEQAAAAAAQQRASRERAIEQAIAEAEKLIAVEEWASAGQVIEKSRQNLGDDPRYASFDQRIAAGLARKAAAEAAALAAKRKADEEALAAKRKAEAAALAAKRKAEEEARIEAARLEAIAKREQARLAWFARLDDWIQKGALDYAERGMAEALAEFPGEAGLNERKDRIADLRRKDAEAKREQARLAWLTRLDDGIQRGALEDAARGVAEALREWPGDPALAARAEKITTLRRERDRINREIAEALQRADHLMKESPAKAIPLLEELCTKHGSRAEFVSRLDQARAAAREADFQVLTADVIRLHQSWDFKGALDRIDRSELRGSDVDALKSDAFQRQRAATEQRVASVIDSAQALLAEQPAQARAILVPLQQEFPERKDIRAALRACEKAIKKEEATARRASDGKPAVSWTRPAAIGVFAVAVVAGVGWFWNARQQGTQTEAPVVVNAPQTAPESVSPSPAPSSIEKSKQAPPVDQQSKGKGATVEPAPQGTKPVVTPAPPPLGPVPNRPRPDNTPIIAGDQLPNAGTPNPGVAPIQTPTVIIAAPPVATPKPPVEAPVNTMEADKREIRAALASFGEAVGRKDWAQALRSWPSSPQVPAWQKQGKDYSVTLSLEPQSEPDIRGNAATVRARMTDTTRVRLARPDTLSRDVTIEMQKTNGRWIISLMR